MAEYDDENVFAKIIDGKEQCFKVFESRASLAFLDASPQAEGHTVVIPKVKGFTSVVSMPPHKAAAFLGDVQRVARAVKAATGASGINIFQANGEDAGQSVFHPHVHIVPRNTGDGLQCFPKPGSKLSTEAAEPVQGKITAALNPPKPLKKPKFGKVSSITPDATGVNLRLKVVEEATVVETKVGKFWEVLCGDASGTVVLSLREHQTGVATKGAVIDLRNAAAKMVNNHVRMAVDKWGKIAAADEDLDGTVEMATEKNISGTEYELVSGK